jgi:hypothetical protein
MTDSTPSAGVFQKSHASNRLGKNRRIRFRLFSRCSGKLLIMHFGAIFGLFGHRRYIFISLKSLIDKVTGDGSQK